MRSNMQPMRDITAKELRGLFDYDQDTGDFRRRSSGRLAGSTRPDGYRLISVKRRLYYAHRLAWLYVYGEWPSSTLDHRNGDNGDNRIANLRLATYSQNNANRRRHRDGTSGMKGVTFRPKRGKWVAQMGVGGKSVYIGIYSTAEEARAAYVAASKKVYGEFSYDADTE